jgi:hypothetical protein
MNAMINKVWNAVWSDEFFANHYIYYFIEDYGKQSGLVKDVIEYFEARGYICNLYSSGLTPCILIMDEQCPRVIKETKERYESEIYSLKQRIEKLESIVNNSDKKSTTSTKAQCTPRTNPQSHDNQPCKVVDGNYIRYRYGGDGSHDSDVYIGDGYDRNGYDKNGLNKHGYDENGENEYGM